MIINVKNNIYMKFLISDNATEVFDAVNSNRAYLRQWLPWVDGTNSPNVIENVIMSWEREGKQELILFSVFLRMTIILAT